MTTGKKDKLNNRTNGGYSLIELLVVVAIMSVLLGVTSLSVSLAFSKDAARCASRLNDAITETRTLAMTKEWDYALKIYKNSGMYVAEMIGTAEVKQLDGSIVVEPKENIAIDLEGDDKKRIEKIVCSGDGITPFEISDSAYVVLRFNKTKGNVEEYEVSGTKIKNDIVMTFDVTPVRGKTRTSKVSLVTGTGKHTIGDF